MTKPNLHIKARDLMQTRIVAVTREYSAREVSILIHSGTYSGVPVIEPGNHLVGIVTEFDVPESLSQRTRFTSTEGGRHHDFGTGHC